MAEKAHINNSTLLESLSNDIKACFFQCVKRADAVFSLYIFTFGFYFFGYSIDKEECRGYNDVYSCRNGGKLHEYT